MIEISGPAKPRVFESSSLLRLCEGFAFHWSLHFSCFHPPTLIQLPVPDEHGLQASKSKVGAVLRL